VKEWLKSVLNYRSYPKIKLDKPIRFLDHPVGYQFTYAVTATCGTTSSVDTYKLRPMLCCMEMHGMRRQKSSVAAVYDMIEFDRVSVFVRQVDEIRGM